jgi:DNA-binding NtrC family response regulator
MLKQTHTILAVDDEPANLRLLQRLLRRDFKVITATGGEAALAIIKQVKISLIITDQRMPGMTGTELLRKGRAINPDMICMVVTANSDTDTFVDAIKNSGAIRVISKPWDPDALLQQINTALEKYELLADNKQAISRLKLTTEGLDRIVRRP